jgi:preprotein translocase subunit SecE
MRLSDQRGERDRDVDAIPEPGDSAGSAGTGGTVGVPNAPSSSESDQRDSVAAGSESEGEQARPAGKRSAQRPRVAGGGASSASTGVVATTDQGTAAGAATAAAGKENLFKRLVRFLREVVAELRKVIWPTRKETGIYTVVVFVFLAFMVSLIFGLDQLFARGVLWLLG